MIQQLLDVAADQRMQIPELVNLDQARVITGQLEIRVVLQKQVSNIVQVRKPGQRGRVQAVALAEFVAEQPGGFGHVVDEMRVFRRGFGDMMVDDDPLLLVQARFIGEIGDPGGFLARARAFPVIIMVGFERHIAVIKFPGEFLQHQPGHQTVKIALVGENHIRLGQFHHGKSLIHRCWRGERGICGAT